jgi:hypothetical protein
LPSQHFFDRGCLKLVKLSVFFQKVVNRAQFGWRAWRVLFPGFGHLSLVSDFEFFLSLSCQCQFIVWCPLGFLDEPVEDDDMAAMDTEQHACNPAARQSCADLPQPVAQGSAKRHSDSQSRTTSVPPRV